MENKKTKIVSVVSIIALALTLVTATYAFFAAQTGKGAQTDIKINASTVDTLTFETGSIISLSLDQDTFASGKETKVVQHLQKQCFLQIVKQIPQQSIIICI